MPFASLVEPETYSGICNDYERSFRVLRSLPADIFLASHTEWFDLDRKLRECADTKDSVEHFIDRDGYLKFIDRAEKRFREELAEQKGAANP
jgi:metallo-beta-lactamase class B